MEKDALRSFPWDRSPLESSASNDLNNAPRITSSLWKSLSEEGIDISMPSFTPNDFSLSEQLVVPNNSQSLSPPLDFWGEGLRNSSPVVGSKLKQKDQWETRLTPQTPDLFGLSSLSSDPQFGTSDSFPNIGNENLYQDFSNGLEGNKSNTGPLLSDQHETTHFKQPYPYSSLASNIWDIDKPNFPSIYPPTSVNGSDVGLSGLSTASLSQLVSKLQQRKALRDFGNLSQSTYSKNAYDPPNFCAPLKRDYASSQKSSTPYSGSQYDIYNSTEALGAQPQRQQTDLVALMQELSVLCETKGASKDMVNSNVQPAVGVHVAQSPIPQSSNSPTSTTKCCVFCKNNNYHSTFYKSHNLKDERGHCQCPVLRMYVCPLCSATGDSAHTLKYCPRNTVTRGDPISAGLPPGKVTNWREVAHRMIGRFNTN